MERFLAGDNFTIAAMQAAREFRDTVDEISTGALMLAMWLDTHGVKGRPLIANETKVAFVKKDSEAERAKRMCVRGQILQIAKEQNTRSLYSGTMILPRYEVVHYLASGSTGTLVKGSRSRFCGFVVGRYFYSNVSGGQTESVAMVGAFDLKENALLAIP